MKNIRNMAFIALIAIFAVSCKQEATSEVKEGTAVKTEVLAENLEIASMNIEGMTCEVGCAKLIEGKLTGAAGVTEAKVDFESKIATVTFDKTQQTIASLTKVVEKTGGGDLYKVVDINE